MHPVRLSILFAAALMLASPLVARAEGTAAGTTIENTAQVTYTLGGSTLSLLSNTASVTVAEILDATVTMASPTVPVTPGATQQELVFTVTNTGNGAEAFSLVALSAGLVGDQFDPILATPAIYFDTDNSNDFSAGDVAYVPGTNDPLLAADASVRVLVINNIPTGLVDNDRGLSQLTASARTGTGAAGTVFAGQGDGGLDAVTGTTGGDGSFTGEYRVEVLTISAVKSQTVTYALSGNRPVPGARITYQVVVTATGTGTATASAFNDPIPANTTYVAGSLRLNGATLSDSGSDDAGEYITTPAPAVHVDLGDLTQAGGPRTIEFAVTIN